MTPADLATSPFVIFGVSIAIGYILYFWSRSVAPRPTGGGDKRMPYVGGEPAVAQAFQPGYQFFYVALFFTLVHVAAMVLAVTPSNMFPVAAMGYLGVVAVAVMILRWEQ